MARNATKTQQQKAVGQGLALGALMLEIHTVNGDVVSLESDFRRAWRGWMYAGDFPAVRADFERNDVIRVMQDSTRRRGVVLTCWEGAWPFTPTANVDNWTADELADVIDDRVPASGWADLVSQWLGR